MTFEEWYTQNDGVLFDDYPDQKAVARLAWEVAYNEGYVSGLLDQDQYDK